MVILDFQVEWRGRVVFWQWRWRHSASGWSDVIELLSGDGMKTLDLGVEWCDQVVMSSTRPGGRVIYWDLEASTRPRGRVVWHDQVPFFQLARQQLQVTWNKHKYATCMQTYPKYVKWWQMMRNGIKQWWYDAKVMTNGCLKHAKYTLINSPKLSLCLPSSRQLRTSWRWGLKLGTHNQNMR